MKALEWYIARRYLASRRKGRFLSLITWIAVGGVFVGVAALITVIAVMTGLQQDLRQKILGNNPHVYVFSHGSSLRIHDWPGALEKVRQVPGVVSAAPFATTYVVVVPANRANPEHFARPGSLNGIQPGFAERPLTDVEARILAGEVSFERTLSGLPGVLIGNRLANELYVYPGDTVRVYLAENYRLTGTGELIPTIGEFEVTGIISTGMYEYDTQNLYAPLSAVQDLLGLEPHQAGGLAVNVEDPWTADRMAAAIADAVDLEYWTTDWMTLNQALFSALKLEKIAMALILFLIVLVAAFNIVSTLIMVVTDKTREIGILKSMGMTSGRVLRIFVLQGLAIGVIGTVLGALGGIGAIALLARYKFIELPADVYFVESLPVALEPFDFALIVTLSIVVSFAATIYPALQASRLLPVEAIRHE